MKEITINVNSVSVGNDEVVLKLSWDEYDKLKAINESLLSALKEWVNLVSWTTSNGITTYDARNKKEKAIIIKAEEAIKLSEQ